MPQCPLCKVDITGKYASASDVEYFSSTKTYDFFECGNCKVLFIYPVPVDELSSIYPANYYSFTKMNKSISFKIKDFIYLLKIGSFSGL